MRRNAREQRLDAGGEELRGKGLLVIQPSAPQQVILTWESPAKKKTEWRMWMKETAWVPLLSMAE